MSVANVLTANGHRVYNFVADSPGQDTDMFELDLTTWDGQVPIYLEFDAPEIETTSYTQSVYGEDGKVLTASQPVRNQNFVITVWDLPSRTNLLYQQDGIAKDHNTIDLTKRPDNIGSIHLLWIQGGRKVYLEMGLILPSGGGGTGHAIIKNMFVHMQIPGLPEDYDVIVGQIE